MANAARLEIDFPFGGKVYSVKPTFEVISSIESATGLACVALADKFFATDPKDYPSLTVTAQVIFNLLRPQDKDLTAQRVAEVLLDDGCADLWEPLGRFLSRCLKGNKDHVRRAEEEARRAVEAAAGNDGHPPVGTVDATSKTG